MLLFLINKSLKPRKNNTLVLILHILTQKLHWKPAGINKDSNLIVEHGVSGMVPPHCFKMGFYFLAAHWFRFCSNFCCFFLHLQKLVVLDRIFFEAFFRIPCHETKDDFIRFKLLLTHRDHSRSKQRTDQSVLVLTPEYNRWSTS